MWSWWPKKCLVIGQHLSWGDFVYLAPAAVQLSHKTREEVLHSDQDMGVVDEKIFTENHTKTPPPVHWLPEPCKTAKIKTISKARESFKVVLFYHPLDLDLPKSILGHELYISEEEAMVSLTNVRGQCYMK